MFLSLFAPGPIFLDVVGQLVNLTLKRLVIAAADGGFDGGVGQKSLAFAHFRRQLGDQVRDGGQGGRALAPFLGRLLALGGHVVEIPVVIIGAGARPLAGLHSRLVVPLGLQVGPGDHGQIIVAFTILGRSGLALRLIAVQLFLEMLLVGPAQRDGLGFLLGLRLGCGLSCLSIGFVFGLLIRLLGGLGLNFGDLSFIQSHF